MLTDRQIRRQTEQRVVKINEVNTTTGHISMVDQYGATLIASLDFSGPVISIPNVGETWTVSRQNTSWYLSKKLGLVSDLSTLSPGDIKINSTGTIYLNPISITSANISDPVFKSFVSGDIQPRLSIHTDGKTSWGPGGTTALDTNLYRGQAGALRTDSALQFVQPTAGNVVLGTIATGSDPTYTFSMNRDGSLHWGVGGSTAVDTNLYRSSAGALKTDGNFNAGSAVFAVVGGANQVGLGSLNTIIGGGPNAGGAVFGTDAWFYRQGVGTFAMGDSAHKGALRIFSDLTTSAILMGLVTTDANDRFQLLADGTHIWGSGSAVGDIRMTRIGAGILQVPTTFQTDLRTYSASVTTARAGGAAAALPANPVRYLAFQDENGNRVYVPAYS